MKIETSKASGLALDWGLSIALGHEKTMYLAHCGSVHGRDKDRGWTSVEHVNAYLCMANIASYKIDIRHQHYSSPDRAVLACWGDEGESGYVCAYGSTPAEAVARCIIEMQVGKSFDVPDELARE